MDGRRIGIVSLRLDALYCAVAAVVVAAVAFPLANSIGVHPAVLFAVAAAVGGWATALWWVPPRVGLALVLRLVLGVNAVASGSLVALGLLAPRVLLGVVLVAAAVEVAAFAVSQAVALARFNSLLEDSPPARQAE